MTARILLTVCAVIFTGILAGSASAQASRKSVSGAEVTGTFRQSYGGKFRGSSSDINIQALGGGKLRISFDLIYPMIVNGEANANMGTGGGEATIEGDTAVFASDEFGPCRITIKFVKPGLIKVTQSGTDADCGFGHNVNADGTYRKVSSAKPKFDDQ